LASSHHPSDGPPKLNVPTAACNWPLTVAGVAEENRGRDIVILDMRQLTPIFDYFVLATGSSRRQLHSISEEIDRILQETLGDHRLGIEGYVDGSLDPAGLRRRWWSTCSTKKPANTTISSSSGAARSAFPGEPPAVG